MKVLLYSTKLSHLKGGAEVFSTHLLEVFPDLSIIDYNTAKNNSPSLGFNFSAFKEPLRAYVVEKHLLKKISEYNPELIFVNGMYGWYFNFVKPDVPIVCVLHGSHSAYADNALRRTSLDFYRTRYIYSFFEKMSAKNADIRVSNSKFTQMQIKNYYDLNSWVIYNAIDTEIFKPLPKIDARELAGLPPDKKIAIFVGRPDYSKGFDIILKLAEIHKDILFLCVVAPAIKTEQKNLIIKNNLPQDELPLYYSSADFLIFPSRFEGFGYVPLEALACNTPIIASKTGVLTEVTPPGSWIVEGHDYKKYSEAINKVLKVNGVETRRFVEENFSFERFSREYRNLVDILI